MMGSSRVAALWRGLFFAAAGLITAACPENPDQHATRRTQGAAGATVVEGIRARLRNAELRRDSQGIRPEDLAHRDVSVRVQAARALARVAQKAAVPLLMRAIHDEEPTVVAWAAYGLGLKCGARSEIVSALVARAVSLALRGTAAAGVTAGVRAHAIDPWFAITDALSRCATPDAERVLRSWLDPDSPTPPLAAIALGRMASRTRHLEDSTLVALLDAASRSKNPLSEALYPFGRLPALDDSLAQRVHAVSIAVLDSGASGDAAMFAVAALGKTGERAVPALKRAVQNRSLDQSVRGVAIRALGALGTLGQVALQELLAALGKDVSPADWLSADGEILEGILESLEPPAGAASAVLAALASIDPSSDRALRVRLVRARCRAAALLANRNSFDARLLSCGPKPEGREAQLAILRVLDRTELGPKRREQWQKLVNAKDPWVAQQALRMLVGHGEIRDAPAVLAKALLSKRPGLVATAAQVLSAAPERANAPSSPQRSLRPEPAVVDALDKAFGYAWPPDTTETVGSLAQAIGTLQLLTFKPRLEKRCVRAVVGLRERIRSSLRLLGEQQPICPDEAPSSAVAPPVWSNADEVHIRFDTSIGPLDMMLDASLAPAAVRRVVDLVERGYYSGVSIHRVISGFAVQFGDAGGDGFGGAGLDPLPCETTPESFGRGSVGMALSGRDTGSSQLFVTLGSYPHLDGEYPLVGRSGPGWERLAVGDVIDAARRLP